MFRNVTAKWRSILVLLAILLSSWGIAASAADIADYAKARDRLEAQIFQGAAPSGGVFGDPAMRQGEVVLDDQGLPVGLGTGPGWLFAVSPVPGTDSGSLVVFVREDGSVRTHPLVDMPAGLTPVAASPAKNAPAPPTNRDEAYALLVDELLGHSTQGRRVYVAAETVKDAVTVPLWRTEVSLSGGPGWLFFVDDAPRANWEHPCRFVLVTGTGEIRVAPATTPPKDMSGYTELTTWPKASLMPPAGTSLNGLKGSAKAATPAANRYAVIISGGYNAANNHVRYWNDCSYFYTTLKNNGFLDANIYVIYADGTNPDLDMNDHGTLKDSPLDLDGDTINDIRYSATKANIAAVFTELAGKIGSNDILYIFTTDHGGNASGNEFPYETSDVVLWLWGESMTNAEFATEANKVSPQAMVGIFEQCFSGGMIEPLKDASKNRVFMSAARFWELSYSMGSMSNNYDEFSYYVTKALAEVATGDSNGDEIVTMEEAFLYALANDSVQDESLTGENNDGEHPAYYSNPWDLGRKIGLGGSYPTAPAPLYAGYSQYQTSDAIPSGGTALNLKTLDSSVSYTLPFAFPFNGLTYTSVTVASNGQLFFASPTTSGYNSINGLKSRSVLAPMWDLLSTVASGDDVYVTTEGTTAVTFAWKAHTRADTTPRAVNAAVKLSANGQIRFLYGDGNVHTTRVAQRDKTIGVSKGTGSAFHYSLRNGEHTLTDAKGILYYPGAALPSAGAAWYNLILE